MRVCAVNAYARQALLATCAIVATALVFVTVIALLSDRATSTYDSFSKVAGVWTPAVSSLIAAGASLWVFYNQQKANAELEVLKADLTRKLDEHRNTLAQGLEFIKGKLAAERKAYDDLHAAAILYYYTLARLEVGKLTPEDVAKADDSMLAASRHLAFIARSDRDLWMRLWQAARAVGERAVNVVDSQKQAALWKASIKDVAGPMTAFADAVTEAHRKS
jgi:hypothetical protein